MQMNETPKRPEPAVRFETEKIDEFIKKSRGFSRLTLQIVLSVAAFILTVEAATMVYKIRERKRDLYRLRERMYGKAIGGPVIQQSDLLTLDQIEMELQAYSRRMLVTTFILLVVVVSGTALIVHLRVVRHVQKILTHDIESLHAKIRFIPEEAYPENEIGAIMHSRNLMLYSLLQAYRREAIESLVSAVDAKDRYTHGHSRRVGHYAALIARTMNLSETEQDNIRQSGYLHDIGKIAIPEEILNAPRALTNSEWEIMKNTRSVARRCFGLQRFQRMSGWARSHIMKITTAADIPRDSRMIKFLRWGGYSMWPTPSTP